VLEGRSLAILPIRNKKPCLLGGYKTASADPAEIARMFALCPGADVGVACGEINGFDVVDVDPRHGGDAWLAENRHRLPETRVHRTKGGGWHLLYQHVNGCSNRPIAVGVDLKTTGGQVKWHPAAGYPVHDAPLAEMPEWLVVLARKPFLAAPPIDGTNRGDGPFVPKPGVRQELPEKLYDRLLASMRGVRGRYQRRARELLQVVIQKPEGGQNAALNWASYRMRELVDAGAISREDARILLTEAAGLSGYIDRDGLKAAAETIKSGLGLQALGDHKKEEGDDEG
jgi:hypothetical protein